jgi:hypothetical protein
MSKLVKVMNENGEFKKFENVEVEASCSYVSLKDLENKAMEDREDFKIFVKALKHACKIYGEGFGDSIDEINDRIYLITVIYLINDEVFKEYYMGTDLLKYNRVERTLDAVQKNSNKDILQIDSDGSIVCLPSLWYRATH